MAVHVGLYITTLKAVPVEVVVNHQSRLRSAVTFTLQVGHK